MSSYQTETCLRELLLGLALRLGKFSLAMVLAFGVAWLVNISTGGDSIGSSGEVSSLPGKVLLAMWLIVLFPVGLSVVFSEFPRGSDWIMFRLGIATFCRTGLPLLIVILVDKLSTGEGLAEDAFGFLAFFYLIGFVASVWVSVGRLRSTESLNGVDSAVV